VGAETNNNQTEYCLHNEVDDFVIDKIETALRETNGNRTHAAKKLGIKRETLLAKIKRYSHSLNCHKS
jgi:transcriptional regulator with PAS, ATPase and Fis domain